MSTPQSEVDLEAAVARRPSKQEDEQQPSVTRAVPDVFILRGPLRAWERPVKHVHARCNSTCTSADRSGCISPHFRPAGDCYLASGVSIALRDHHCPSTVAFGRLSLTMSLTAILSRMLWPCCYGAQCQQGERSIADQNHRCSRGCTPTRASLLQMCRPGGMRHCAALPTCTTTIAMHNSMKRIHIAAHRASSRPG